MTSNEGAPPAKSQTESDPEPAIGTGTDPATAAPAATESDAAREPDASVEMTDAPLIPEDEQMDFRSRWEAVQQGFVDEPRTAVTDADRLVGDVLQRLSTTFEDQHHDLERRWSEGEPSTEDLRSALQLYRTFFDRLLNL
jgi:hypothetical protein